MGVSRECFDRMFEEARPFLERMARSRVGQDGEDVVQSTYCRLMMSSSTYDPSRGDFRTWATTGLKTQIGEYFRQKGRDDRLMVFRPIDPEATDAEQWESVMEERQRTEQRRVIKSTVAHVHLSTLSLDCVRQVEAGETVRDAALRLHLSKSAVGRMRVRTFRLLRDAMGVAQAFESDEVPAHLLHALGSHVTTKKHIQKLGSKLAQEKLARLP